MYVFVFESKSFFLLKENFADLAKYNRYPLVEQKKFGKIF